MKMKKEDFEKYKQLSKEEYQKGSIYALANAIELFDDAMIMRGLYRNERAFALLKLSLEESAKAFAYFEISTLKALDENSLEKKIEEKIKILEDHNKKTEYALELLSKKRVRPPEGEDIYEDNEFKKALERFREMNLMKNLSLYTSLVENKLQPPYHSIGEDDVIDIEHIALNMLSRAKEPILNLDESLFISLNINKEAIKKHNSFIWVRRMNTLQLVYKDHVKEVQKKHPYYESIMEEDY